MAAITVSLIVIADAAVDPESPVDTTLVTGLRDNIEYAIQWIGHSFRATAVQDHNHDGVNSAKLQIGANSVRNGSFEDAGGSTTGWTLTNFTGGSNAINSSNDMDGQFALAITSTVLANGGAQAETNEFDPITGGALYDFKLAVKASVANVSSKAEVVWFDDAQAQISLSSIYTDSNTPTSAARRGQLLRAPSAARFCKVRLTGGIPATGSATGTVYFDGVVKADGLPLVEPGTTRYIVYDGDLTATGNTTATLVKGIAVPYDGTYTVGYRLGARAGSGTAEGEIRVNGTQVGTPRTSTSDPGTDFTENLALLQGDRLEIWANGVGAGDTAEVSELRLMAA